METGVWFLFVLLTQGRTRLCTSQPDGGLNPFASSLTTDAKESNLEKATVLKINCTNPQLQNICVQNG